MYRGPLEFATNGVWGRAGVGGHFGAAGTTGVVALLAHVSEGADAQLVHSVSGSRALLVHTGASCSLTAPPPPPERPAD